MRAEEVIEEETFQCYCVRLKTQLVGVDGRQTEEQNQTRARTQRTHIQWNCRVKKY